MHFVNALVTVDDLMHFVIALVTVVETAVFVVRWLSTAPSCEVSATIVQLQRSTSGVTIVRFMD